MPLTFAHPAAVVPIKEKWPRWFDLTALVLGSMAPDFEYFIYLRPQRVIGHTVGGYFYYNLPLVFMIAILWHYVIKRPLILSLPKPFRKYGASFLQHKWDIRSIRAFLVFIASAILGMATHVFWDAFTHANTYFVRNIAFLSYQISILNTDIYVYKALQHGSSLVGFLILFLYISKSVAIKSVTLQEAPKAKTIAYWLPVALTGIGIVTLRVSQTLGGVTLTLFGVYVISFVSGLFIGIIVVSFIFNVFGVYEGYGI